MPFRMDRGAHRAQRYPFVQIKPGRSIFAVFTCGPEDIAGTPLHWLGVDGGSVPCGRESCRYCPKIPIRYHWFAPVMEWYHPSGFAIGAKPFQSGSWRKAVLRVTEHLDDMLLDNLVGKVCEIFRPGPHKNSRLNWKVVEPIPDKFRLELSPHDVMPTLEAAWHMYRNLGLVNESGPQEETA